MNAAPRALVPDNLKSGVTRPCYYDPELNPTYRDLAAHYSAVVQRYSWHSDGFWPGCATSASSASMN